MKKKILSAFLLVNTLLSAQVTKTLGDFTKVTAFDKIKVVLIPSSENKVEVKGKYEDEVETIIAKDELKIKLPVGKFLNGDNLTAKVYFKKIEAVESNEGSYLSCESTIKALDFGITAKEGAQIKVLVEAQRITVKSYEGAEVYLSGKAQNIDVVTNSGGKLYADKCFAQQATASINAGGIIEIYATDLVDAKTRAGGRITIYGNPKQVNEKKILGGKIIISKK